MLSTPSNQLIYKTNMQQPQKQQDGVRPIKIDRRTYKQQKFEFNSYDLAFAVRDVVYQRIIQFDVNLDLRFDQNQIRDFLVRVLQENQNEIHYFVKNVFRYDYNNDGIIEYDELVDFCMEQHIGQIAIQRLHRQKIYSRGAQRIMNQQEFIKTINFALSFLQFNSDQAYLSNTFANIDLDKDGYLSYQDYFRFLKEYFGSKSLASDLVNKNTVFQEIKYQKEHGIQHNQLKPSDLVKKYSKYESPKKDIDKNNASKRQNIQPTKSNFNNDNTNNQGNMGNSNASNMGNSNMGNSNIGNSNIGNNNVNGTNANNSFNGLNNSNVNGSGVQKKRRPSQGGSKIQLTLLQKLQIGREAKMQLVLNAGQAKLSERIARLVYSQLKVLSMQLDSNKDCLLSADQVWMFVKQITEITDSLQGEVYRRNSLSKQKNYGFDEVIKLVMFEHINKVFKDLQFEDISKNLSSDQFATIFAKVCSIVSNTPLTQKYECLYQYRSQKGAITIADAHALITFIFSSYIIKK